MADRIPLVVDSSNRNIKELPAADNLDLGYSDITRADVVNSNVLISTSDTASKVRFYYANVSDFPSATTYHGAIAHAHNTGKMYFAHGGVWIPMVSEELTNNTVSLVNITASSNVDVEGNVSATYYEAGFSNVIINSGAVTYDLRSASVFRTDLSNDIVSVSITNPPVANTVGTFLVQIVGTGLSNTITWPNSVKYKDNTAPTIGTGSGNVNTFAFYTIDGGTTYIGSAIVGQYS